MSIINRQYWADELRNGSKRGLTVPNTEEREESMQDA